MKKPQKLGPCAGSRGGKEIMDDPFEETERRMFRSREMSAPGGAEAVFNPAGKQTGFGRFRGCRGWGLAPSERPTGDEVFCGGGFSTLFVGGEWTWKKKKTATQIGPGNWNCSKAVNATLPFVLRRNAPQPHSGRPFRPLGHGRPRLRKMRFRIYARNG